MLVKEPQRYGIVELGLDRKNVPRTVEKPNEPKLNLAVISLYGFSPTFLKVYPKLKQVLEERDEDHGRDFLAG